MRYDDRLATVLSGADAGVRGIITRWRQVVDLLAQRRDAGGDEIAVRAFRWLADTRASVPLPERIAAARAVAGRAIPTGLLLFFAEDAAVVAAPVLRRARLPADDWLLILPRLGPTARALLRHREDLPLSVKRALTSFGGTDLVLEGQGVSPQAVPSASVQPQSGAAGDIAGDDGQIRSLVQRIEAFRQRREDDRRASPAIPPEPIAPFRWECGVDGVIDWTDAPRPGAVIGHGLGGDEAETAEPFAARRPFRDAPTRLPALGALRLSGVPVFEPRTGRFIGYRGTAAPAAPGQDAALQPADVAPPSIAVREMVHELRTPLNAITGFAEMIAGEYLGPAAPEQRKRAVEIRAEAERLQLALEDLDFAARVEDGDLRDGASDLQDILIDEHPALERQARERRVTLGFRVEPGLPPAAIAPEAARRLIRGLIVGGIQGAGEGASVQLSLRRAGADAVTAEVTRPAGSAGDGLSARVARDLAKGAGGALSADGDRWLLRLPAHASASTARELAG